MRFLHFLKRLQIRQLIEKMTSSMRQVLEKMDVVCGMDQLGREERIVAL